MDKYTKAIRKLRRIKDEEIFKKTIREAWLECYANSEIGCLFQFAGEVDLEEQNGTLGCLTMIRNRPNRIAATKDLTEGIRKDERIPTSHILFTRDNLKALQAMREWQLRIDKEIRNLPKRKN
jgi:hypothetical protein